MRSMLSPDVWGLMPEDCDRNMGGSGACAYCKYQLQISEISEKNNRRRGIRHSVFHLLATPSLPSSRLAQGRGLAAHLPCRSKGGIKRPKGPVILQPSSTEAAILLNIVNAFQRRAGSL